MDGPYDSELQVEGLENLVLVAQGAGILDVLPIALHITDRKRQGLQSGEAILGLETKETKLRIYRTSIY